MDPNRIWSKALVAAAAGAAFYLAARVGLALALPGAAGSPLWPAAGLAMAAALVLGPEACLGILGGYWLATGTPGPAPAALAGALLLKGTFAGENPLSRPRDVARFAALALLACLAGLPLSASAYAGDAAAALIVVPLVFAWRPREKEEFGEPPSPLRALNAAAAAAAMWLAVELGFGGRLPAGLSPALCALPVAALLWLTVRFGSRGATAGAAMLAALVAWHSVRGFGPFAAGGLEGAMLLSSVYAAAAAATALFARAWLAGLREDQSALERRLSAQGDDLWTANAHLRVAALGRREDGRRIQLYRRIFAEVPVGLAVLRIDDPRDPETWLVVELNPSGLRLSGAAAENPAGRRLFDFAPELRGTELPRACAEALRMNHGVALPDIVSRGRVPGTRFAMNAFPLGAPFVGLAFENITARKTAEETLARSNSELSQFAFVASHDLQAPLRKIATFSDHLRTNLGAALDPKSGDFLDRIGRSVAAMQALIDSLLELAQVGASAEEPREVDLGKAADDVIGDLEDAIARRGADVKRGPLPVVMGDPSQLHRLLQNLIGNALKFTPSGRAPRVRLRSAAREDGRCELIVEDEGVGFDMAFASGLFLPFQRLHSRKDFPGSGMGLAICRKIVERHGGTISVQSAADRGTRVTVVLPSGLTGKRALPPLESAVG